MKKAIFSFIGIMLGMVAAAYLLPGLISPDIQVMLLAGLLLGAVYLVLRPVLRLVSLPLNLLTLGLLYVAIDAALLWFVVGGFEGMMVESFGTAVLAAVIVNCARSLAGLFAGR